MSISHVQQESPTPRFHWIHFLLLAAKKIFHQECMFYFKEMFTRMVAKERQKKKISAQGRPIRIRFQNQNVFQEILSNFVSF